LNNAPIGIFDSGKGGLTVLEQIKKQLPRESVIYYGDVARVPFGGRSPAEIIQINFEIISYLMERGVKLVIIACNTSSALAIEEDKQKFAIPIVGMIQPGSQAAVKATKNGKIGVLATEATVKRHTYKKNIQKIDSSVQVSEVACPKLVPLVEAGSFSGREVRKALQEYLSVLSQAGVDTIVHGCTHYPFLEEEMRKIMGGVSYVDPAVDTVQETKRILVEKKLLADNEQPHIEYVISQNEGGKYVRVDGREYLFRSAPAYRQ